MNKYPGLRAVMISCEQRELARLLTIPQFEAIGIPVFVSLSPCSPAGPQQNCVASGNALRRADDEGKDCLFLEDDLDIDGELFAFFLERAIKANAVTYFYLHDKPGHMEAFYGSELAGSIMMKQPIRRDLYEIRNQRHMYGSQAVYIPRWFYKPFVRNGMFDMTHGSFDVFLSRHVGTRKHQALVALPHPVQHRHDRTARVGLGAGAKFSASFGMPWVPEGDNKFVTRNVTRYDFCAETDYALERLIPVWNAFPWEHRGTFFVPQSAIGLTPLGGSVAPVGAIRDSDNPLVVFDARSVWEGHIRTFGSRSLITLGGDDARIPFRLHGFPHLRFAHYGEKQEHRSEVGFVFTKTPVFAESCRFLSELADSVLAVSGRPATELGNPVGLDAVQRPLVGTDAVGLAADARPGDVHIAAPSRNAGVRIPGNDDGNVPSGDGFPNDGNPNADLGRADDGAVVRLGVVASAADHLYHRAEPWFRKHGIASSRDSLWVIRDADVVASDSEFILMEAAALGKKTVMMDSAGMWPVRPNAVPIVDPEVIANKILEVTL